MPTGSIYSHLIVPETIAVLSQPKGARTGTMGGIMALRISKLGAKGALVDGRMRDVRYLKESLDMPVWCKLTSIVATSGECKAHAVNVPIYVGPTKVEPNDIILLDPAENEAICIPKDKFDQVLEMLPGIAAADERKMGHVLNGMSVEEAARIS
ncbi:RraA-like protein [Penicillium malachiteum]|uniref:RraA-like protein n=1 Tax=Penicillium malachiteum TaxID=1324776 RepID=UPI0025474EC9|nr:RraA-like protein [Penicillium malachiteum]KAJ5721023.1 RraA-like protein [Penicillium malachiteum]